MDRLLDNVQSRVESLPALIENMRRQLKCVTRAIAQGDVKSYIYSQNSNKDSLFNSCSAVYPAIAKLQLTTGAVALYIVAPIIFSCWRLA